MSTDRLIEALWGDDAPTNDLNTLQVAVSSLRKALSRSQREPQPAKGLLITRRPGYMLRVKEGELDLHRFERLAEQGREAMRKGDPERSSSMLREALGLW